MGKVYGIFDGEYSAWGVKGFFTDELEAEKYCAFDGDSHIIELECLDGKIDFSNIELSYSLTFYVDSNDVLICVDDRMAENNDGNRVWEAYVGWYGERANRTYIDVVIKEKNHDKAMKIAQDMYAKYKAEKAEI